MIAEPALAGGSSPVSVPEAGILLRSDGASRLVRGRVYQQIVPLIDGRQSSGEAVAFAARGGGDAGVVWNAL